MQALFVSYFEVEIKVLNISEARLPAVRESRTKGLGFEKQATHMNTHMYDLFIPAAIYNGRIANL